MTTFRYKPDKIKYRTSINTLDALHRKRVNEFEDKRTRISDLKSEIEKLEKQLIDFVKPPTTTTKVMCETIDTINEIKNRSVVKSALQKKKQDLYDIENNVSELEYYSQTNDILLDYYREITPIVPIGIGENIDYSANDNNGMDNVDMTNNFDPVKLEEIDELSEHFEITGQSDDGDSKNNSDDDSFSPDQLNGKSKLEQLNLLSQMKRKPRKITKRRARRTDTFNNKCILDFFSDKAPVKDIDENEDQYHDQDKDADSCEKQIVNKSVAVEDEIEEKGIEKTISNKATLLDEYMTLVDKTYISKERHQCIRMCMRCNTEKTLIQSEGFYVCQMCGEVEHTIIESEIPSHKDNATEKNRYPYKRVNHLIECIHVNVSNVSKIVYL